MPDIEGVGLLALSAYAALEAVLPADVVADVGSPPVAEPITVSLDKFHGLILSALVPPGRENRFSLPQSFLQNCFR